MLRWLECLQKTSTNHTVLRHQIEMAHKVLGKDMQELVQALKQAQRYSTTTLDEEYRK